MDGFAEQAGVELNVVHEVESVQPIRYLIREAFGLLGRFSWSGQVGVRGHVGTSRIVDPTPVRTLPRREYE